MPRKGQESYRKGKTYIELYGLEKSNLIKAKFSLSSKGKTRPLKRFYKNCLMCNKEMYLCNFNFKRIFCSHKCFFKYKKLHFEKYKHTEETKRILSIKRTQMLKDGTVKLNPWHKGKTKETDIRIKNMALKLSTTLLKYHPHKGLTKFNSDMIKQRSENTERNEKISRGRLKYLQIHSIGHGKGGFREDLGHYCRSTWEANFCRILKKLNINYEYEPKTFSFDNCKYTPDIYLKEIDLYVEIKGYLNNLGNIKITAFKRYYNNITIIDKYIYNFLTNIWKDKINFWEN